MTRSPCGFKAIAAMMQNNRARSSAQKLFEGPSHPLPPGLPSAEMHSMHTL